VKINDGEFEILFIKRPHGIMGYIKTIIAILLKKHSNKKYFEYYQTDKIKITSKAGIPWTVDGEFGGRKKEVEINNINKAIEYVIPM
jgi:diacylglycerol kinase family enzyme